MARNTKKTENEANLLNTLGEHGETLVRIINRLSSEQKEMINGVFKDDIDFMIFNLYLAFLIENGQNIFLASFADRLAAMTTTANSEK